jgi:multicomponent Na+:H+ antiporter subunit B
MTAVWTAVEMPVVGVLNTVLFFDTGVYLVVVGVTLTIIFAMAESEGD